MPESAPLTPSDIGLAWLDAQARPLRLAGCLGQELREPLAQALAAQERAHWCGGQFLDLRLDGRGYRGLLEPLEAGGWLLALHPHPSEQELIDAIQHQVLEAVALDRSLPEVMQTLCLAVEAVAPELMCSVLAVDAAGLVHPLAAPSLPAAYCAALDGAPIGPNAGSCGTAAWRREPVDVRSIATDPLWADYKALALPLGLASCWSTPVLLDGRRVGATFALYTRVEQPVRPLHRRLVEACIPLCRVALLHQEHKQRIERLAYYDAVTGLPNRSLFTQQAQALLAELGPTPAALLLLDLDHFKAVNELQGHATGNEVLRQAAQRLVAALPGQQTLARLGDDEFVVLLPRADRAQTEARARTLCAALAAPLSGLQGQALQLGVSIGYSLFPEPGASLESLLKQADLALNHAKASGRNCVRGFSPGMAEALEQKSWLQAELRRALDAEGLQLHFQPKPDLRSERICGAEVLLRWPHAERGWIAPDRFIPVAEDCGLIAQLDDWVLQRACTQLAEWRAQGLVLPALAVNVSPPLFLQLDVAERVAGLLQQHGLPGSALALEVTERLMLDERQDRRALAQLAALRAIGVTVSIDDFGTGYSSLSYLRRLPVSELKLDRSFVANLERDADDRALTRAVVSIAEALGLELVAEGVESLAQVTLLRELGCPVIQGYWLARPMPAAEFAAWCRRRQASAPD